MKALVLAPFAPHWLKALGDLVGSVCYENWMETRRLYDPEELGQRLQQEQAEVLVVEADFVFEETLEQANALRLVAICRNALNQVDVAAASVHGVLVTHTPGRNANAVAEHALGLMLALARQTLKGHTYVAEGRWQDPVEPYLTFRGIELQGRIVGIVGLGAVGSRLARLGHAIGMEVLAYDPYVTSQSFRRARATRASLDDLLRRSDFVSLHASVAPGGPPLLNAQRLALMKPTAYLVNTAAAELVDAEAVAQLLHQERLAGAATDVFLTHPLPANSPLLRAPNVILTPHIGGATAETVWRQSEMVVSDVERLLQGRRPRHLVNPEAWRRRRGR